MKMKPRKGVKENSEDEDLVLEMPCLGRPFRIGSLYDCYQDELINKQNICNFDTSKEEWIDVERIEYRVINGEHVGNKFAAFGVDEERRLSLASRMILPEGASGYLFSRPMFRRGVCLALKCSVWTRLQKLDVKRNFESSRSRYSFEDGKATHAVCQIQYGGEAVFVLNREVAQNENLAEVVDKLKTIIGRIIVAIKEEDKKPAKYIEEMGNEMHKTHLNFFGDIRFDMKESDFDYTIHFLKNFPRLVRMKPHTHGFPTKVWLYPLSKISTAAPKFIRRVVNPKMASELERLVQDYGFLAGIVDNLARSRTSRSFPGICVQLEEFKGLTHLQLSRFLACFNLTLREIRVGKLAESFLEQAITDFKNQAFGIQKLRDWLSTKEWEIKCLDVYCSPIKHRFCLKAGELNVAVRASNKMYVLIFDFGSVRNESNCFVSAFRNCCADPLNKSDENCLEYGFECQWYNDEFITNNIDRSLSFIKTFINANESVMKKVDCLVDSSFCPYGSLETPGNLFLCHGGTKERFRPPSSPGVPQMVSRSHSHIELQWDRPRFGDTFTTGFQVEYKLDQDQNGESINAFFCSSTHASLFALESNSDYVVKVSAVCVMCVCSSSAWSPAIKTLALPGKPEGAA